MSTTHLMVEEFQIFSRIKNDGYIVLYLSEVVVDDPVDESSLADFGVAHEDDSAEVEVELRPGQAGVMVVQDVQPLLASIGMAVALTVGSLAVDPHGH